MNFSEGRKRRNAIDYRPAKSGDLRESQVDQTANRRLKNCLQTKGKRSEKKIPTGKLFGLRKFDLIETSKGIGFVKGKRLRGCFAISDLEGDEIESWVNVKKNCRRISARATSLKVSSFQNHKRRG